MQCYIILGSEEKIKAFIESFTSEKKIASYNSTIYSGKIKIDEVRLLQKKLIYKNAKNESSLVILPTDITVEAQNALLKTLEELPEGKYICFTGQTDSTLLPTILSRCQIIRLEQSSSALQSKKELENTLKQFLIDKPLEPQTLSSLLSALPIAELKEDQLKDLIYSFRNVLLESLSSISLHQLHLLHSLLSDLTLLYPLVKSNNINPRLGAETIFLKFLSY